MNPVYSEKSLTSSLPSLNAVLISQLNSNNFICDIQQQNLSENSHLNCVNDTSNIHSNQSELNKLNTEFIEKIVSLRPMLEKAASLKLRNRTWAEDAVSDTIVAALENPSAYSGQSMVRTWLVGILKNKIVDQIRLHTRECQNIFSEDENYNNFTPFSEGVESCSMSTWSDPEETLSRLQFIAKLNLCLKAMPKQQANAFISKYALDKDTNEICEELCITSNNLNVMLHRIKYQLRISMQVQY